MHIMYLYFCLLAALRDADSSVVSSRVVCRLVSKKEFSSSCCAWFGRRGQVDIGLDHHIIHTALREMGEEIGITESSVRYSPGLRTSF